MGSINKQLDEVEALLGLPDEDNPAVSAWSVYQQLEHILLVKAGIATMIERNQAPSHAKQRSMLAPIILLLGYIPRGKAKSPAEVSPEGMSQKQMKDLLDQTRVRYRKMDEMRGRFGAGVVGNHPYFGGLSAQQWLRFVEVHTRHHLKIIRDISQRR